VQQDQMGVEPAAIRQRHTEHGWQDDRRVAEDHRHDEAEENGVEDGIVRKAGLGRPGRNRDEASDPKPDVSE